MGRCRDNLVVKITNCSSGGPKFNSQHRHSDSQQCITPVTLTPSSGNLGHHTHSYCIDIHEGKAPIHIVCIYNMHNIISSVAQ